METLHYGIIRKYQINQRMGNLLTDVATLKPRSVLSASQKSTMSKPRHTASTSQTLKPSNPSRNFLLEEDDEESEEFLKPSSAYSSKRAGTPTASDPYSLRRSGSSASLESGALRRTPSGMFMPFEGDEEEPLPPTLIGRVVDTVNTARDIGHVIWNAAWSN